jgi:ubiquinone/menaquinone biosynthesis C-methylase UbiE
MNKFYNENIFYRLMDHNLGQKKVTHLRQELLTNASGEVLEIGFGTGLNLMCYPERVCGLTAIDICHLDRNYPDAGINLRRLEMSVEAMTFVDNSFDTVVSTFTLCSIPQIQTALSEIYRVLKPGGKFLFLEHTKNPNRFIASLQNLANPLYNILACGCNVNRDIRQTISASGLIIQSLKTAGPSLCLSGFYLSGIAAKTGALC